MVQDDHLAKDVTQNVFAAVAADAEKLSIRPIISGWLHRTTQNIAANLIRAEVRRRSREQEAFKMNHIHATQSEPSWSKIEPHLDAVLNELSDTDRETLLLRYFQNKSLREIGSCLGSTEDAAQKKVSRALERLRDLFASRGITVGASVLAIALTENTVHAAPAGLLAVASVPPSFAATAATTLPTVPLTAIVTLTAMKKTMLIVAALIVVGLTTVTVSRSWLSKPLSATAIAVNLDNYVGQFAMPDHTLIITKQDKGISIGGTDGGAPFVAYPQSETQFVSHDQGSVTTLTFLKDGSGRATSFKLIRDGRELGELKRSE
jgi:RNA polymerase sigma factor (sigma-70 family)